MSSDKVLILGPSWIGDMVMAQSLFQTLKQIRPGVQIDVAAPAWTLPLLERMPEVSHAISLPFKHGQLGLVERFQFGKRLRGHGYTQSISLVNTLKSALLPWAAQIPQRTGFLGEMRYGLLNDIRPLDKSLLKQTVQRFVALGYPKGQIPIVDKIPQPKLYANLDQGRMLLNSHGIQLTESKCLALCPGAEYGEAKRWPIGHFAEVATAAINAGWQVILFGSEKDQPVTQQINSMARDKCIDLGGITTLGDAIDIMAHCTQVISNDSGLMHIAAALDLPLVSIFGSSDPSHTPPIHPDAMIEYLGLSCSPCFKRTCPLGHLNCLNEITPSSVIKHIPL